MRTDVLGVGFDNITLAEAGQRGAQLASQEGFHYVVTPNPEFILTAKKDDQFRALLNGAHLVIPDGVGVTYAAKILGRPLQGKVPGIDFAALLLQWMAENGKRLYLLGAKPGVAEQAALNLLAQYPGIIISGVQDGYFQDSAPIVEDIRNANTDVIFVCLGAPKQELWMAEHGPQTGAHLAVGLGGSLDVFAGVVERAPESFQRLGLEWFYRLLKEPARIKRMIKLPLALVYAVGARIKGA